MKSDRSVVLTQLALAALAKTPLSEAEHRVLWHLATTLPASGDSVSKTDLGSKLGITRIYLHSVMRQLCQSGFLMRGARMGRSYHYKLNPAFLRLI